MHVEENSPAGNIILISESLPARASQVDDTLNIVVIKHLPQFPFILRGEKYAFSADIWDSIQEFFDDRGRAVKLKPKVN